MPPQGEGHQQAARRDGDGGAPGRADHAQPRPGHADLQAQEADVPRFIDQKIVQNDIDAVDRQVALHGRPRVAGGPEHRAEDHRGGAEQHGHIGDEEIAGGQGADGRFQLHPSGHLLRQGQGQGREQGPDEEHHQHRLGRGPPGPVNIPRASSLGDDGKEAHPHGPDGGADEPVDGGGGAHGGGGRRAQSAHHGSVHILHGGLHELFQHGGSRQAEYRAGEGEVGSFHRLS